MLIILAWLPLKVSVTLSAILTAGLLFLAFRQAADFVLVTVLAIAMLWRGEAWKTVFLESERQLSELKEQRQTSTLPKTESAYSSQRFLSGGARCAPQVASFQSLGLASQGLSHRSLDGIRLHEEPLVLHEAVFALRAVAQDSSLDTRRISRRCHNSPQSDWLLPESLRVELSERVLEM